MPCLGLTPNPTSTAISCLDFKLAWDISGATPTVTVTNNSTVAIAANLKWWFYITSPSAVPIYGQNLTGLSSGSYPAPDVNAVAWTSKVFTLPTPFGNAPCGQVEFSPNSPYVVTIFVEDTTAPSVLYQYAKNTIIVRPSGNTINTCGNFGMSATSMKVDCGAKVIMCFDSTNLIYNNILTPLSTTNTWTLVYPQDPSGNIPNNVQNNVASINFPISVNSDGYTLYFQEYATYDYGNNVTVKVQYKAYGKQGNPGLVFAVNCNTNLCLLQCQMRKFYELSQSSCGVLENAELTNKMVRLNWIFSEILTGIFQPLCGIDVPMLIEKMKQLGKFDDNCDCGCGSSDNFGFSNPTGSAAISSGCCPVFTTVVDVTTGNPVSGCPGAGSYFPSQVYNPDGTAIIGTAYNIGDEVSIVNANAQWQVYGTAFVVDNCQIGWYPAPGVVIIPKIQVDPNGGGVDTSCTNGRQNYPVTINDICYANGASITNSSFPLNLYVDFGSGMQFVGNVASPSAMIIALNNFSSKPATITFLATPNPGLVTVVNSDCTTYSGVISVSVDAGSRSYLLYGPNHHSIKFNDPEANNPETAMSLSSLSLLGGIPDMGTKNYWHNIRIGNYLLGTEPETGKVYFWDITNPLNPTLARVIQLSTPVGATRTCFTGLPKSATYASTPTTIFSFFGLYFPTDYCATMGLDSVYVVESVSGTIWKLNLFDTGTGTVASFQDNRLIGKCPRVVIDGVLYFTQDGNLESATGQTSTIPIGSIVELDISNFTTGGLFEDPIISGGTEPVWAASYNGVNSIYFTGQKMTVVEWDVAGEAIANTYPTIVAAGVSYRLNSAFYLGKLYYTPQHLPGYNGLIVDVASLSGTLVYTQFQQPPSGDIDGMFTFTPLGNCLGILTSAHIGSAPNFVGVYMLDGTFVNSIGPLNDNHEYFNVIPIPNVSTTTPNNFIP